MDIDADNSNRHLHDSRAFRDRDFIREDNH